MVLLTKGTKQMTNAIDNYRNNPIIMKFVTTEAIEKTASDIRAKTGSGTTAKAVELLMTTNSKVAERVAQYIEAGLVGCLMAANIKVKGQ